MNRRSFLKASTATAAALTAARRADSPRHPGQGRLQDSRVGSGEHTYECHHDWGTLPGEFEWQTTHNVTVDSQGLVYITHQGLPKKKGMDTFVFDATGSSSAPSARSGMAADTASRSAERLRQFCT